jgi:hypothetical protein
MIACMILSFSQPIRSFDVRRCRGGMALTCSLAKTIAAADEGDTVASACIVGREGDLQCR